MTRPGEDRARERCRQTGAASKDALDWIRDPENAASVKPEREQLSREFRRHAVECGKLESALGRPMAIGVFGASQAGKSYLIDRLVSKNDGASGILFEGQAGPLDFIEHLNPLGGTESTAIATRFSIRSEPTPAGFPVVTRIFSVADLARIIGDLYYAGFDVADEPGLSGEEIDAALAAAAARAGRPVLALEDFWSIRDFLEKHRDKANPKALSAQGYWERAEALLDRVDAEGLALLLAPIWAAVPSLTELFGRFLAALAALDFPDRLFCPLDTLVDTTGAKPVRHPRSIINVSLLEGLIGKDTTDGVTVATPGGARVGVERVLLGALVSELSLTVVPDTWDYLARTDIIDFPGLRPPEVIRDFHAQLTNAPLFGRIFKDAKIRFLFERYKNERELNGLIFCVGPSVQDVPALPGLIEDWIATTHGATPEERVGTRVSLFIVLTKFDEELLGKRGEDEAPSERWQARLKASLLDRLAAQAGWLDDWTPGKAFDNVLWFRNPNIRNPGIMSYESGISARETAVNPTEAARFRGYRDGFLKSDHVQRYVADPPRAWDEVFRLNDGGLSYIVEKLAPICDEALRLEQINGRIEERRRLMRRRLDPFHVATDAASRLAKARETGQRVAEAFAHCAASGRAGRLLGALQINDGELADRFSEVARRTVVTRRAFSAADLLSQAGFATGTGGEAAVGTLADVLANAALEFWAGAMRVAVPDSRVRAFLGLGEIEHGLLVDELIAASARLGLRDRIADDLREAVDRAAPGHSGVARAALSAANRINGFVYRLGYDAMPPGERPRRPGPGAAPIFAPGRARGIESLGEEPFSWAAEHYADWMLGFGDLARRNAERIEGSDLNIAQNERLREILGGLAA